MVPRIFHFVFLSNVEKSELDLFSFVAIKSCLVLNNPQKVILHCNYIPVGKYWERLEKYVTPNIIEVPKEIFGNKIIKFAHAADVIRIKELLKTGGVYLDLDTICLRPFPEDLFTQKCVMGLEKRPSFSFFNFFNNLIRLILTGKIKAAAYQMKRFKSEKYVGLCNAVIFSEPDSKFLNEWLKAYKDFDEKLWNYHSVIFPYKLSRKKQFKKSIKILNHKSFFYPGYDEKEINMLFSNEKLSSENFPQAVLHHLWLSDAKKYLKLPNEKEICLGQSYYSKLSKKYLNC